MSDPIYAPIRNWEFKTFHEDMDRFVYCVLCYDTSRSINIDVSRTELEVRDYVTNTLGCGKSKCPILEWLAEGRPDPNG
jgi:hypothetical protein